MPTHTNTYKNTTITKEQHGNVCIAESTNTLTHGPTKYQHTKIHSKKTPKLKRTTKILREALIISLKRKAAKQGFYH